MVSWTISMARCNGALGLFGRPAWQAFAGAGGPLGRRHSCHGRASPALVLWTEGTVIRIKSFDLAYPRGRFVRHVGFGEMSGQALRLDH